LWVTSHPTKLRYLHKLDAASGARPDGALLPGAYVLSGIRTCGSRNVRSADTTGGAVVPDPGPGSVLVRVAFDGGERSWRRVPLQAGCTFVLELDAGNHEGVELVAHFEGSADFGPAYSEILVLARSKSVG
jgi:hypothetical protein